MQCSLARRGELGEASGSAFAWAGEEGEYLKSTAKRLELPGPSSLPSDITFCATWPSILASSCGLS